MSTQQYAQMVQPQVSIRPSSGAWNPSDDQTLMAARAQGMNWAPIQQAYFPTKTPNACRKRHERLMERRNADDWDGMKLENMAKHYMSMRREIWSSLAAQTGEKWNVVEQKVCFESCPFGHPTANKKQCMSQGLKNLQTAARSCARRERLLDPSTNPNSSHPQNPYNLPSGFENDSGYAEDLEGNEYDADGASERSGGSYGYGGGHHHTASAGSSINGMVGSVGGNGGMNGMGNRVASSMGNGNGVNMMDSRTQAYMMSSVGVQHQSLGGVNGQGQRLPSMDMGIDAIINRPSGGR